LAPPLRIYRSTQLAEEISPNVLKWPILFLIALIAFTLAAITGFGGAAVPLPVPVAVFGVRDAAPILTVVQVPENGSRAWFNRHELNWRVVVWFAMGGVPTALLGGNRFASVPLVELTRLLGAFLLLIVFWHHLRSRMYRSSPTPAFADIGARSSVLSVLLGSVGPIMALFSQSFGLVEGDYIGTEALSTVVMHVTMLIACRQASILTCSIVLR